MLSPGREWETRRLSFADPTFCVRCSAVLASGPHPQREQILKIAFYHRNLPRSDRKPGGVQVFVHRIANALSCRDHDVTVFTHDRGDSEKSYSAELLRPALAASNTLVGLYAAPWLLNVRPSWNRFDVLHLHGDDWFFRRRPIPTVRTFYGSAIFEAASATSWRRRINSSLVFGLEQIASRRADAVYGIGTDSRALFRADGVLALGVTAPTERGLVSRPDRPIILFVGTWEGRKRGKTLRDMFVRDIQPMIPTAQLWMVTDYAEESEGVHWFRSPDDETLSALYAQASVFCLTSLYEGFGIPYLEAMSHGLPIVATPNPGAVDVLGGGAFGVLAEDSGFSAQVLQLLTVDDYWQHYAEASIRGAAKFRWPAVLDEYERAYDLAISRFRHRKVSSQSEPKDLG